MNTNVGIETLELLLFLYDINIADYSVNEFEKRILLLKLCILGKGIKNNYNELLEKNYWDVRANYIKELSIAQNNVIGFITVQNMQREVYAFGAGTVFQDTMKNIKHLHKRIFLYLRIHLCVNRVVTLMEFRCYPLQIA